MSLSLIQSTHCKYDITRVILYLKNILHVEAVPCEF